MSQHLVACAKRVMDPITENTVRQLIEQVHQQRLVMEAQQEEIKQLMNGSKSFKTSPKPPKPEFYKGKRDAVEIKSWIDQIDRYSKFYGMTSQETAELAIFYLSGSPEIGGRIKQRNPRNCFSSLGRTSAQSSRRPSIQSIMSEKLWIHWKD